MTSSGLIAVAAVLVIGTAVGLWRRRTDGRLHAVGPASDGTIAIAGLRGPATGPAGAAPVADRSAAVDRSAAGTEAVVDSGAGVDPGAVVDSGARADPSAAGVRLDPALLAELGVEPAPATLLQFSSAFCAPCRALRRVSSEVAALLPAVRHVEVDAESHLDAVRALGIWRTPTLLVLDADGRVVKRATGVPAKQQLIAVLGDILPAV